MTGWPRRSRKDRPHRIAFVSDAIWPYNKGGKEKRSYEVSQRLSDYGRDVHVYTMKWWDGPKVIERDGVTLHAISALHPLYAGNRRSLFQALMFGIAVVKLLFEPFDILEVDAIPYFPTFSARLVCTVRRKKLVTTWHEVWGREYWDEYLGGAGFIGSLAERLAIASADHIVAVSEHTSGRLRQTGSSGPTSVLLNGVDLELLERSVPSGPSSDVLFAGRLLANKNVDILIRSISLVRRHLPDIRCLIVGEGPEREALVGLVAELGLEGNVSFLDFVPDLYGLMKASRVFVLPSIREGFGLVVVEANACGLPVITTRHPDNAARLLIIEGENGYLTDPEAGELAGTIEMALGEDTGWDPRRVAVENGLAVDWDSTARALDALFAEVATGRAPSDDDRSAGSPMPPPERVVFVSSYYPPHLGGMENVAEAMAKAYAERQPCTVLTTTCGADRAPRLEVEGNLEVRRYRSLELAHTPVPIGLMARLVTLPRRTLVHVHVTQALVPEFVWLSSMIRRRKFVAHFHLDIDASGPFGAVFLVYKRLVLGRVLRAAETVICLSTDQADFLGQRYGVERTRIRVLPNGVSSEFFAEPNRATGSSPLKLLYVGRLTAQKNVPRLIEAVAKVGEPVELVIVGDGQQRGMIEEAVRSHGLDNVRLVGAQRGGALSEWYRWADVFVLPSDREGMPLVLLEAMAAALPIISTDVMGSRELLGETGLLVPAEASDLAGAIERLAVDPDLRIELAERSSRRAQDYRWDNLAEQLEQVYGAAVA